ncbi:MULTISPECIES: hypothetical protein [Bacilli]|uniref:Uncharacterized protein n=1 Tax=Lactobacillus johnsonii TaxID=33959 RepID=A0A9X7THZ2_LACJH|nr:MULTISPECIES: hypothetical protein [Bacilli]QIA88572.1 hypothetical protein FEE39_10035 [Lactobacillus johnsonii]QIA88575.1 hypothetical protein FEE39_10050 [Lactobacillus johnsonii]
MQVTLTIYDHNFSIIKKVNPQLPINNLKKYLDSLRELPNYNANCLTNTPYVNLTNCNINEANRVAKIIQKFEKKFKVSLDNSTVDKIFSYAGFNKQGTLKINTFSYMLNNAIQQDNSNMFDLPYKKTKTITHYYKISLGNY